MKPIPRRQGPLRLFDGDRADPLEAVERLGLAGRRHEGAVRNGVRLH